MSVVVSLATLLVSKTKAEILKAGLAICTALELPVTTWQAGDPTRAQLMLDAEILEAQEQLAEGFISSGFLDYASGWWLKICAKQFFNVDVPEATFATTDVVVTNPTGYVDDDVRPGDWTFKCTLTGKTFHNITGGVLPGKVGGVNGTLTVTVEADEAGSESSAGAGEIDDFVSGPKGVTCSNPVAAVGSDEQDPAVTKAQCRAKAASFSPNGPADAYTFVAREKTLTGTSGITDARSFPDSDFGDVVVYLRGPSGAVSDADRTLAETAILKKATPLCITPTVLSVANVVVPVTYELWVYKSCNMSGDEVAAAVELALEQMLAKRPIGGDIIEPATTGKLYRTLIESTIKGVLPDQAFRVVLTLPAADVDLTNSQVAALGAVTPTVNLVKDPT